VHEPTPIVAYVSFPWLVPDDVALTQLLDLLDRRVRRATAEPD
jgi:hypothetical protein